MWDDGNGAGNTVQSRSRQQVPGRTVRRVLAAAAAASTLATPALILPGASAAPRPTIQQVQQNIDQLHEEAEQATEQYNETKESLGSINVRLRAAREKLKRQKVYVARARVLVGKLASETYRRGQMTTLDILLSDDPEVILAQAGFLPSLTERQNGATNRLKQGVEDLAAAQKDLAAQQKRAEDANQKMRVAANTVQHKLAQARAQLASLKASERAALRRSQIAAENAGVPSAAVSGGTGSSYCLSMASKATNSGARAALQFACNQLGDPYVWAADGPDSWDCSGLTMKSWAAGGVSLPHSSQLQAGYGTRVSASSVQPGDLVFFNSPISHVGLYLGDGLMVHAPHTGDIVRVAALYETPSTAVRL